jgi:hypothetical protein
MRPFRPIIFRRSSPCVQSTRECAITRSVMSICASVSISSPTNGRSVPNASECIRIPTSSPSVSVPRISSSAASRFSESAALMLKKRAETPAASMSFTIPSTCGSVLRRSRCTPKIGYPAPASARAAASPNPLEAPRMRAQRRAMCAPDSAVGS